MDDGDEIVLMVRADGLPKPEVHWFFNGKPVQEDGNHKIATKDDVSDMQVTSTLTITGYNKEDSGQVNLIYLIELLYILKDLHFSTKQWQLT